MKIRSFSDFLNWLRLLDFRGKRIVFYRDWAKSMERGELLTNFLKAELEISMSKLTRDSSRAYALRQMLARAEGGKETAASQVVGLTMPDNDMMMLAAGDSASEKDLIQVLHDLCIALEEQSAAKKVLLKNMTTPLLMAPGMAIFAYVFSSTSIPIIEKIAPPETWTPFNNAVRVLANFIHHSGPYLVLGFILFAGGLWYSLSRWTGKMRLKMERITPGNALMLTPIMPWLLPLSIFRDYQAVMILSSLSVLLKSDRTLKAALQVISGKSTPYVRAHVERILAYIDEYPLEVSNAFATGILSPRVAARLATISRTTNVYEDVLIEVGTIGAVEIRNQVNATAVKLNFVLLIGGAAVMVLLYIGQMSITNTMRMEMDPLKVQQRKMEKEQQIQR